MNDIDIWMKSADYLARTLGPPSASEKEGVCLRSLLDAATPIRRIAPIYKPLGVYRHSGYPRYIIEVQGEIRCYRGADLPCLAFLLDVYPDAGHWRRLFPRMSSKIDSKAAAAWFMRECQKLGDYDLAADLKPRPVGRPKSGSVTSHQ